MLKTNRVLTIAGALQAIAPGLAAAADLPPVLNAPASAQQPTLELATQFDLKLRLPEGRGLARLLIDAGVNKGDAATAARLAAGHMGAAEGGCAATVSVSRDLTSAGFRLVRVQLLTQAEKTVIERRADELTVAAETPPRKAPRLV